MSKKRTFVGTATVIGSIDWSQDAALDAKIAVIDAIVDQDNAERTLADVIGVIDTVDMLVRAANQDMAIVDASVQRNDTIEG